MKLRFTPDLPNFRKKGRFAWENSDLGSSHLAFLGPRGGKPFRALIRGDEKAGLLGGGCDTLAMFETPIVPLSPTSPVNADSGSESASDSPYLIGIR